MEANKLGPWAARIAVASGALLLGLFLVETGHSGQRPDLIVASLLVTTLSLSHALYCLGWRRALTFFGLCTALSWVGEVVSVATGLVGAYRYTQVLGPQLAGVPVVIPLTWFMMAYPAFVLTNLVARGRVAERRASLPAAAWLALVSAGVLTCWDLSMDPYMVRVVGAWKWLDGGPWFGVPLANYVSWAVLSFAIFLLYRIIERRLPLRPLGRVSRWHAALPVGVYALFCLGDLFVGDPPDTKLIALFTMGLPVLAAVVRLAWDRGPWVVPGGPVRPPQPSPSPAERKTVLLRTAVPVALVALLLGGAVALHPALGGTPPRFVILVPIFAAVMLVHAIVLLGWRQALALFAVAATLSLAAELLGTKAGLLFGQYAYADDVIGAKLFGEVPFTIPLTWFIMMYPSYLIAGLLATGDPLAQPRAWPRLLVTCLLGALLMTAWDLTLDPYMVELLGAWHWSPNQGATFLEIPLQNYLGWAVTTFTVMLVARLVMARLPASPKLDPSLLLLAGPLGVYAFMSLGDVAIGYPELTRLLSPFAMGVPLALAVSRLAQWRPESGPRG